MAPRFLRASRLFGFSLLGFSCFLSSSNDSNGGDFFTAAHRVFLIGKCGAGVLWRYKEAQRNIQGGEIQRRQALSRAHEAAALDFLQLAQSLGGLLVKAGQHLASLVPAVPREFSSLAALQDNAAPQTLSAVYSVIEDSLGGPVEEFFLDFHPQPIGVASLAQVHKARLLSDGSAVAVKVQHKNLSRLIESDLLTLRAIFWAAGRIFPDFDVNWIYREFAEILRGELDFTREGKNSERSAENLRNFKEPRVKIPTVHWPLTRPRVLTMELVEGLKVDDRQALEAAGISPIAVALGVSRVAAAMIFHHGFVHVDLHPGNLLVRQASGQPLELFILDHGMYREIKEEFRLSYCGLWAALIRLDEKMIKFFANALGIPQYSQTLPLLLTHRPLASSAAIGADLPAEEREKLRRDMENLTSAEIVEFLAALPRDLIFAMRVANLTRSLNFKLGGSSRDRLLSQGQAALAGLKIRNLEKSARETPEDQEKLRRLEQAMEESGFSSVSSSGWRFRILLALQDFASWWRKKKVQTG